MDLANYLNECCLDNAYPKGVGIKEYMENFPSKKEIKTLIRTYLKHEFGRM